MSSKSHTWRCFSEQRRANSSPNSPFYFSHAFALGEPDVRDDDAVRDPQSANAGQRDNQVCNLDWRTEPAANVPVRREELVPTLQVNDCQRRGGWQQQWKRKRCFLHVELAGKAGQVGDEDGSKDLEVQEAVTMEVDLRCIRRTFWSFLRKLKGGTG